MGQIIYWKKYKKPKIIYDAVLKVNREAHGIWVCKDKRVDFFAIIGYCRGNEMGISAELVMKNGDRKSFKPKEIHNKVDDELIEMAENYLKQI